MNVTKKHQYGLLAMCQLANLYQSGPVQLRVIADAANIPHSFLEQLILDLKKSGLVSSTRGAKGGYQLTKLPTKIRIEDIFSAIEPLRLDISDSCQLSFFWSDFNDHIQSYLNLSLSELVATTKKREKVLSFSI